MRVLVFGGRNFRDRAWVYRALDWIDRLYCVDVVIEGEASGADQMARQWAEDRGVPFHPFPADWDDLDAPGANVRRSKAGKLYNAAAGPARNRMMLDEGEPDIAIGFPGGDGTADMARQAKAAGVKTQTFQDRAEWLDFERRAERDHPGLSCHA